ncbi:hypothetical protein SAMN02910298_02754 [Pseudobutyrivibrio sp. YE44]|nr:hypothetical protein SAMN02910298_02754 [Pseudobutyrivibrio sp. YE44]
MKIIGVIIKRTISVFAVGILSILCILSIRYNVKMNFQTFDELAVLYTNSYVKEVIVIILLVATPLMLWFLHESLNVRRRIILGVTFILLIIHAGLSVLWIKYNTYPPLWDQKMVWDTAKIMVEGKELTDKAYFEMYPFQGGMVYIFALLMRISGISNPLMIRILNVMSVIALDLGIILIGKELCNSCEQSTINELGGITTAILLIPFLPLVIYTTYVYGTLFSIALITWSFYGTVKMLNTSCLKWLLIPLFFLPISNVVYTGSIIATVAVVVVIIFNVLVAEKKQLESIMIIAALVILTVICKRGVSSSFNNRFTVSGNNGISPIEYLYMGLTSDDGVSGPGSYNASTLELYNNYNMQGEEYGSENLLPVIEQYMNGSRKAEYFKDKTIYQWLEPYWGGLSMTIFKWTDYELPDEFELFLEGGYLENYNVILSIYIQLMYLFSLAYVLLTFKEKNFSKILNIVYFIGGFIFYLGWEAKARYCLPYFVLLLPLAANGIIQSASIVDNIRRKKQ